MAAPIVLGVSGMGAVLRALGFIAIGALVITVGDALWQSCQSGSWKLVVGQSNQLFLRGILA